MRCIISKAKLMSVSPLFTAAKMLHQTYALRTLLREADCVISPSKIFAKKSSKILHNRVCHISNPVNPLLLGEEPMFDGDGSILFMGRLEYEKGVHLLLALAKILKKFKINIIGKGSLDGLFLEDRLLNLSYYGYVKEDEKMNLIRRANVLVVPSIWCDMFPTAVFEAFTFGKPVVAFDLGGPKEMIEASGCGLLATPFEIKDFAEKVKYLIENQSEAKKRGLMGRKWVEENLRTDRYAEKLVKVYGCAEGCRYD